MIARKNKEINIPALPLESPYSSIRKGRLKLIMITR